MGVRNTESNLVIGHEPIEEVQRFAYVCNVLSDDGDVTTDVNCRNSKASAVFQKMRQMWPAPSISIATRIGLYNAIVIPVAIYASETWKTTARVTQKLNVFHQRCLRKILGVLSRRYHEW
jgi:hypothetical protein